MPGDRSHRVSTRLALALAAVPYVWVLAPLLFAGRFYCSEDTDTLAIQFPLRHLLGEALHAGRLPLWTRTLSNGYPLLAEGESGGLHPLNLALFRAFTPYTAYQVAMALAPLLAFAATFAWLRMRGRSPAASAFGAMGFALGGYALGHLRHLNHVQAMVALPLALLALERFAHAPNGAAVVVGAAALASTVLFGMPQLGYLVALALTLRAAWWAIDADDRPRRQALQRSLVFLALAAPLAGLLAAPQLLLTLDLVPATERAAGLELDAAARDSLGLAELLHFVLPHAHGIPAAGTYALRSRHWETLGYVGIVPLAAAFVAAGMQLRRRRVSFALALALLGVWLAFGTSGGLYSLLWELAPGFRWFRVPGRFLLLTNLGLAVLAAEGLDALLARLASARGALTTACAPWVAALAVLLAGVDLGYHGAALLPWMTREDLLAPNATVRALRARKTERVLSMWGGGRTREAVESDAATDLRAQPHPLAKRRALVWHNWNAVVGVATVGAYLPLAYAQHKQLELRVQHGLQLTPQGVRGTDAAVQVLRFLRADHIVTFLPVVHPQLQRVASVSIEPLTTPVQLYALPAAAPRAYLASDAQPCTQAQAIERIERGRFGPAWIPCRVVAHEEASHIDAAAYAPAIGTVETRALEAHVERYAVSLERPGHLVVQESYDPGWTATVDGAPARVEKLDLLYRGVAVPAGRHEVVMRYAPRGLPLGLALALFGALLSVWALVRSRSRRDEARA